MDPTARNGLIAFATFFILLFVILTLNMYESTLDSLQSGNLRGSTYDEAVIRDPVNDLDEVKEFKHETITREELGRNSWFVLHLITGNYPENPDKADKKNIEIFLNLFAQYYPCKECGSHFYQMLQKYPVRADSREELMDYLCGLHNKVNERLHKPQFDCKLARTKWSDCGCDSKDVDIDA